MRKIRELLRLKFDLGLSIHKISASPVDCSIHYRRVSAACVQPTQALPGRWRTNWATNRISEVIIGPKKAGRSELLEARWYPKRQAAPDVAMPDFAHIQREPARPGVTRLLLWQEYKDEHPDDL